MTNSSRNVVEILKSKRHTTANLFKCAIEQANQTRKSNTSNLNFAIDVRDELAESLSDFICEIPELDFYRAGLKMQISSKYGVASIRCHNTRGKKLKKLKITEGQLPLPLEDYAAPEIIEVELAYTTTPDRKKLKTLSIVDFNAGRSDTIYDISKDAVEEQLENNIRIKHVEDTTEENLYNIIRTKRII
ncbi:MAG: hypothetical protein PHE78_00805 [Candidatus Gastranaerophilales bacterium]|nr:hypothetical protein [Candidatus Gastranaerophilales bacterium]